MEEVRKEHDYELIVIEGNAVDPKDSDMFNPDALILLGNRLGYKQKIERAKEYSDENAWVHRREDEYLEKVFKFYQQVEDYWRTDYNEYYFDMTDFHRGQQEVLNYIEEKYNDLVETTQVNIDEDDEFQKWVQQQEEYARLKERDGGATDYLAYYLIDRLNTIFRKYHGSGREAKELRGYAFYNYVMGVDRTQGAPILFYKKYPSIYNIIKDINRYSDKSFHTNRQLVSKYQKLWWIAETIFGKEMERQRRNK